MFATILHPRAPKVKLCANARLVYQAIKRLSKGHPECWASNATLARMANCCERTVKNCLKKLRLAGLIQTIMDYSLRSRRRIVHDLSASPPPPTPVETQKEFVFTAPDSEFLGGKNCPQTGQMLPPTAAIPPDPPIEVPEGNTEREIVFGPPPADAVGTTTTPNLSPSILPEPEQAIAPPEPEPAEVTAAIAAAAAVWGDTPAVAGRVRAEVARGTAPEWVRRAVEAARKAARRAGSVGWGYVVATLKDWHAVGGPPPAAQAAIPPPSRSATVAYHVASAHRRLANPPRPTEGDER